MNTKTLMTLIAGTAMLALSGCAGLTSEADLAYDGNSNGSHSDSADCDADGAFNGSGSITDGSVRVTVTDSDGTTLFSESYSSSFTLAKQTLTGDSGEWTIKAQRSGDDVLGDAFRGDYDFFLNCEGL